MLHSRPNYFRISREQQDILNMAEENLQSQSFIDR